MRIEVVQGAGGKDAIGWSHILLNMYKEFTRSFGPVLVWDRENAIEFYCPSQYERHLINERGHHRLIRNSPSDRQHRRQTSFAKVRINNQEDNEDQIRTYVFDPYLSAKNHYDDFETDQVHRVLGGDLAFMWQLSLTSV